jgi:hypothetical protein
MRQLLILGLFVFCITTTYSQPLQIVEESVFEIKTPELKDVLSNFKALSSDIDKIYNKDTTRIELFLQLEQDGLIDKVQNFNNVPESLYASYNIIKGKSGHIVYIAEYPFSESGDWNLIYENYFDENGNLLAFVRKCSFFNSECAEIVHEKSEYYCNTKHELIKKTFDIKDGKNKTLDFKKCVFNYRFEYKSYLTLSDFLKNYRFQ